MYSIRYNLRKKHLKIVNCLLVHGIKIQSDSCSCTENYRKTLILAIDLSSSAKFVQFKRKDQIILDNISLFN